ncbi:MAG: antibiotic biosynthesis monooxygenase [Proteobacteria bacterium]|nr:antibiotic biosynthesis monooxygenase [Pseudomonadota bacterium]
MNVEQEICRIILAVTVPQDRQAEIVDVFQWGLPALQAAPGFIEAYISKEIGDPQRLRFTTEWRSQNELEQYLRTNHFNALLSVVELDVELPEICFEISVDRRGLAYLSELRESENSDRLTPHLCARGPE